MLTITNLGRDFTSGERTLTVLNDINLEISDGEFVAITGPSGSGKSTFLGLMAGLDRPTRGSIVLNGTELTGLSEDELSRVRGREMGFVFQSFQLIQTLTALENVRVPAEILGDFEVADRAMETLTRVGLADRANHFPTQLSGGEMQRIAIARASITRPSILFADEPTGNLDSSNGQMIMDILQELNRTCTLILVTHNPELAAMADREVRLKDGRINDIIAHRRSNGQALRATGASAAGSNGKSKAKATAKKKSAAKKSAPRKSAGKSAAKTTTRKKAAKKKTKARA